MQPLLLYLTTKHEVKIIYKSIDLNSSVVNKHQIEGKREKRGLPLGHQACEFFTDHIASLSQVLFEIY